MPDETACRTAGISALTAVFLVVAMTATAQPVQPPAALGASPLPDQVETRFCYFSGLAYSPGSLVTVEVPVRRDVVTDRPHKALRCVSDNSSQGRFYWRELDPDEGDPFRN